MAVNELFDTGIKVTGSFSAAGAFPVDAKFVVDTIAQRDDHDTQNRSYEGMLVYVKEDGKTYQKQADGWKEFGFDTEAFEGSVYDGLDSDSVVLALAARQGKVLDGKITSHTSDAISHITAAERLKWNAKASNAVATTELDGLMSHEDKVKLDGIDENANNYTHPESHPATMITEDTTHRFVTDAEKASWGKTYTKEDIGLGNVTNDAQVKRSEMGVAMGVATLDATGVVPSSQLPSYVDDVVEVANFEALPSTGESGKIYVDIDTNTTYRWSGTQYTAIGSSLALGENASTAYPGDKGKANADAIAGILDGTTSVANSDKTNGHTVEADVPADAVFTDTVYTHPESHPATMITEDTTHKFVTDTQISTWNAKANNTLASSTTNGLMSKEDKSKLDLMAKQVEMLRSEFDVLPVKDNNTWYIVTED